MEDESGFYDPDLACDVVAAAGMLIEDHPSGEITGTLLQPGRVLKYRLHRRPDKRYIWLLLSDTSPWGNVA